MRSIVLTVLALIVISTTPSLFGQASFQGIGDLSGGVFQSVPWDISGDGTTVVGWSIGGNAANDNRSLAFRWTDSLGMEPLGILSQDTGKYSSNRATAVSFDGKTIVGAYHVYGSTGSGVEAFYWNSMVGMTGIGFYTYVDSNKHQNGIPEAVSSDGSKMAGRMVIEVPGEDYDQQTPFIANTPGAPMNLLPQNDTISWGMPWDMSADGSVIVGRYSPSPITSGTDTLFAVRWVNGSRMDLGNLNGGYQNDAQVISADGKYIAGLSGDGTTVRVFRWTQAGGMDSIGTVSFVSEGTTLTGISADGRVVTGLYDQSYKPVIWIENRGELDLKEFLINDVGLDFTGWTLTNTAGVSDSGNIITGNGTNPSGFTEGWVANITHIKVLKPDTGDFMVAGESDTIRWSSFGLDSLVAFFSINYDASVDTGTFFQINDTLKADSGYYVWDVPDTILSKRCAIRLASLNDSLVADTSGLFKIKGYVLTRDSADQWEPYRFDKDSWGFSYLDYNMWPPTWFRQFRYRTATDPYTNTSYPQDTVFPFYRTDSSSFPDWPLFVQAYGQGQCYWGGAVNGTYSMRATKVWDIIKHPWYGSCTGFSLSSLLAFYDSAGFADKYTSIPMYTDFSAISLDADIRKVINELWIHQFGVQHRLYARISRFSTPSETIQKLKTLFLEDAPEPSIMTIENTSGVGAHDIVPYKVWHDTLDPDQYFVYVYDNNVPGTPDLYLQVDTTSFGGKGEWYYNQEPTWGGDSGMYLQQKVSSYLSPPVLSLSPTVPPATRSILHPNAGEIAGIKVAPGRTAGIVIHDTSGNGTGYSDSMVVNSIPGAWPFTPATGSPAPPFFYELPGGIYSIVTDSFETPTSELSIITDSTLISYRRNDASPAQADRFVYDGDFSVINTDPDPKSVIMDFLISEDTTAEKNYTLTGLVLTQDDSLILAQSNHDHLKVVNAGAGKIYGIQLNYHSAMTRREFRASGISMGENSSHEIVPDWTDLGLPVRIYIDNGNDGTIDDSIFVATTVGVVQHTGEEIPRWFSLGQNYPNPFNPTTRIPFTIAETRYVKLAIYDILGRQVSTLVDQTMLPGAYEVPWDASALPAGVYYARMTAGQYTATMRLMYIK